MAILRGPIDFTGKLGGLSVYRRRDMDKTIVRTPGGASKRKIKTAACFARTREINLEWKGCGRGAGMIRWALIYVKHLADHAITGKFSSLCKIMQLKDTENKRGERSILISKNTELLEGFSITQRNPFDGVVRHPLKYEIDKATGSAWVQLPNLMPEINFFVPWQYPFFRFVISLGAIMDLEYNYPDRSSKNTDEAPVFYTDWQPTGQNYTGELIKLQLKRGPELGDSWTRILAIGLEMGTPISNTVITTAKYVGCAKILTLA